MKAKFKKRLSILIAIVLLGNSFLLLSGCELGEIRKVENAIDELDGLNPGQGISIRDYREKVMEVCNVYEELSESAREKVKNVDDLSEAIKLSDKETIRCMYFDNLISMCDKASDAVYLAWYYGIYEADDDLKYYDSDDLDMAAYSLAKAVHFVASDDSIEQACEELGYSVYTLKNNWATCVLAVIRGMEIDGNFENIYNQLNEYKEMTVIGEETKSQLDFVFQSIENYIEFIKSPDGSLLKYSDKVGDLKDEIQENRSVLARMIS